MEQRKVIIIGSGPAGLTAALYAARANLAPLIFEGIQPGGQLTITTEVENFPGFVDGIMGPELMDIMRKQAHRFGAESVYEEVTKVDLTVSPKKIWVDDREYSADTVIVATGASAKLLGLEGEKTFMGYGVSACATCDGFFFRGLEVAVVGGGDSALEEAMFLTRFASKVTIIHRRDQLRASKIMQERAFQNPKVGFLWNTVVEDVCGSVESEKKRLTHIVVRDLMTGKRSDFPIDGLFLGIGHEPNSVLFREMLEMDNRGYLITEGKSSRTNIPGVFACGDVQDRVYRQAITAAGSGCVAAIDAERYLEEMNR